MDQVSRPISDVFKGSWTPASSPPSTLFNQINLPTPSGSTNYVTSSSSPVDDAFQCLLAPLGLPQQPPSGGSYGLTVQLEQIGGGSAIPVEIMLLQGTTIIATAKVTPSSSYVDYTLSLTPSQIAMIANPGDLRVQVTANPYVTGCSYLNPAAAQYQFTMSGLTNGTCSECGLGNRSVILTYDGTGCSWSNHTSYFCSIDEYVLSTSDGITWTLHFTMLSGPVQYTCTSFTVSGGTFTLVATTVGPECNNWPSTLVVTAV